MELLYCSAARESKTLVLLENKDTRLFEDSTSAADDPAVTTAKTLRTAPNLLFVVRMIAHAPS